MLSILISLYKTFFYVINLSVVEPHRLDHSNLPSAITGSEEFLNSETVALIVKLAHDDLADVLPADCFPLDEELVHEIQVVEYNKWFSIAQDAKLAKSIGDALVTVTDAAYLDAFITAEEAATEDRIAAELLSRGEPLPVPKSCQIRLEDPAFVMDPGLIIVENGAIDNGESVGSGDHLIQDLVN
jgi:hypothetical protein